MADIAKIKELSRQLNLFCWLLSDYLRLSCGECCTFEEEITMIVVKHISKLSSDVQCEFLKDEIDEYE